MNSREQNEHLLREHQAIFENAAMGIVYSRGSRIDRCNRRVAEMFGYDLEELVGQEAAIFFADPDDYVRVSQESRSVVLAGGTFCDHVEMRRKDGSAVYVQLCGRSVDSGAAESAMVWTLDDISGQRRAEHALDTAQRELEAVFQSAVAGIALVRNDIVVRCNRRFEEIFGYAPGEMIGLSTRIWFLSDEEHDAVGAALRSALGQDNDQRRQQMFRRRDGSAFWGEIAGRALDPDQPLEGSVWLLEDISASREILQRLELAQRVVDGSSEAVVVTDAANRIVSVNRAFERITGFCAAEVMGRDPGSFKSGRHDAAFYRSMWEALRDTGHWRGEIWDRRKDGSIYPKLVCIDVVRDPASGEIVNHVAVFSDITERKAHEEQFSYLAHHDPLTGLANRLALGMHLGHELAIARRNRTRVAVLFIDLDGFKPVNDRYGHAHGDSLLVTLAERLREHARESDLVARLGGDEFVIVLEGGFTDQNLATIAAGVVAAVSSPCALPAGEVQVSCSIGIACAPQDGETPEALLASADAAMYRAKLAGRGRYVFCEGGAPDAAQGALPI